MYTTVSRVREISGFDNVTNIADTTINGKIAVAQGMVSAAVGQRYSLPLRYHFTRILTFSGTGSGSGTMAVIINGVTYNVAITIGATAAQIADVFRRACIASEDFIVDAEGLGAAVRIISLSDSSVNTEAYAQIEAPAVSTVAGISLSFSTIVPKYPPVVEQITADIAAAFLLMDNYGVEAEDTSKDGARKMLIADKQLMRLQGTDKDGINTKLYDEVTNTELALSDDEAPIFAPNDTTSAIDYEDENGMAASTAPQVSMNQIF